MSRGQVHRGLLNDWDLAALLPGGSLPCTCWLPVALWVILPLPLGLIYQWARGTDSCLSVSSVFLFVIIWLDLVRAVLKQTMCNFAQLGNSRFRDGVCVLRVQRKAHL